MKTAIYGQEDRIIPWVGSRIDEDQFGDAVAIGLEEDGELIAGVVFNLYTGPSIMMHVAAVPGRRWNLDAQRFDEHLGFKREGLIRKGASDGSNLILYGMLKEECRWLEIKR